MSPKSLRILLVEDEASHVELIRRTFMRVDVQVELVVAGSLAQAREFLTKSLPDIVIIDWLLPDGMGTELIENKDTVPYPTIIMTSYGNEQAAVRALKAGALDYVVKTAETLLELPRNVDRVLREWGHIIERRQAEAALQWELAVNSALSALYKPLISPSSSMEDISSIILAHAQELTSSEHGYVSSIDPVTQDNVGHTLTEILEALCQVDQENPYYAFPIGEDGLYAGLCGYSLNTKEALFTNTPETHPTSTAALDGAFAFERFLSVPVLLGDELVGQIVLANAERDYSERDVAAVQRMAEFFALAIQRKRTEEALRERELLRVELEKEREISELKSRFVSMASHEFRTPLASIQFTADMLRHYMDRLDADQRDQRFDQIQMQVQHMTSLLDAVLTIGKSDAGATEFKPEKLDLDRFCRNMLEEFQHTLTTDHQFYYTCDCADGCTMVYVDPNHMRQIVTNLLSNAVKYSPDVHSIRINLYCDQGSVALTVADQGIGIPEADLKRLFEPFHRARNVHHIGGTGLGLAIVKNSVEGQGGSIEVDSAVGVGTTFTIRLPKESCTEAASS